MKHIFFALLLACAAPAMAGELDANTHFSHGLIVRVNAQGAREVFKADVTSQVETADDAVAANAKFLKDANRIAQVSPGSELDRTSSSEAWFYWYAPAYTGYYYYTYNYVAPAVAYYPAYTYSIAYYPTYTINAYGYQYYYYWYHL
jgi:hypothetical protein